MSLSASREKWKTVAGIVTRGHRVASGKAEDSPYPAGTIQLQKPFFKALGLDLSSCHGGTLNLSIHPYTFEMTRPRHTFRQVEWTPLHPPEDFSFSHCLLIVQKRKIPGWILLSPSGNQGDPFPGSLGAGDPGPVYRRHRLRRPDRHRNRPCRNYPFTCVARTFDSSHAFSTTALLCSLSAAA